MSFGLRESNESEQTQSPTLSGRDTRVYTWDTLKALFHRRNSGHIRWREHLQERPKNQPFQPLCFHCSAGIMDPNICGSDVVAIHSRRYSEVA